MNAAERTTSAGAGPRDRPALILIDDDPLIAESLAFVLRDDYAVSVAATRAEARGLLRGLAAPPALALVDLGLPPTPHSPEEGFALVGELLAFNPRMKILILSGQSDRRNIQHALTLGAVDFVPKPADLPLLKTRLAHQLMLLDAERVEAESPVETCGMLGGSPAMATLRAQARQFADTPFPVLIEGESGSGKELVAQCLHSRSQRAAEPFLSLNCAAIAAELIEAQLFGHARGAFTGASAARPGFFEEAGTGTLFLDEIGEFPLELQPKLLRVLENGEYYRVGETRPRRASARVIAATNRDLREQVRTGRFREDLYHRLGVLTIRVPPLRERGDDALELLDHFRQIYGSSLAPFSLDQDARSRLAAYPFPGNVRELRNIVIRLAAKQSGQRVTRAALEAELDPDLAAPLPVGAEDLDERAEQQIRGSGFQLDGVLTEWERRYVNAALRLAQGNLSQAARLLGVNRTTLYSRIQRLNGSAAP
ncbi:MAG: sigma-54 dependent transcriptional regulator [Gammaproteobacteria bacterium]|jgi:DNA-binding NtrC family response regulator|nr:sigma-54 dependent transcriptional regulator [Gammaproteobacteria bacterium]